MVMSTSFSRPAAQPRETRPTTSCFRTRGMATTGSTSSSSAPESNRAAIGAQVRVDLPTVVRRRSLPVIG